jgi:hypothetical protein
MDEHLTPKTANDTLCPLGGGLRNNNSYGNIQLLSRIRHSDPSVPPGGRYKSIHSLTLEILAQGTDASNFE